MTPKNVVAGGCDYDFKSKKILFFQARFTGTNKGFVSKDGSIDVNASYLIAQDSLVQDQVGLRVIVQEGDELIIYTVQKNITDSKGFHDTARTGVMDGSAASLRALPQALAKVGGP